VHILVIGINYWPEETSVGPFTTGLCEHLVANGHRVSVVTAFPYYPEWRIREGYRGRLRMTETINGVSVRRVRHYVPRRPRDLVERLLHDLSFSLHALIAACAVRNVDAIYCSSPPPFTPTVSWLHARLRGVPYGVSVTDLASDAALSTGIMSNGLLARLARALEKFNYTQASGVSVLCDGFKQSLIGLGVPAERVSVVPSWADTDHVTPLERNNAFRRAQKYAPDDFLLIHAGNIGLKQNLETVVEAAALSARDHADLKWLMVGDGEDRERLERVTRERHLTNLRFVGLLPKDDLPAALASANALVLTQRAAVTDSVIPSKLLTYLASGRPIIAAVNSASETAIRLTHSGGGVVVTPERPRALLEAALELRRLGGDADTLGLTGRRYVEAHYSKPSVLKQYDQFFGAIFPTVDAR
jgi:colanic acid biosynthesis glycosyl transferase WcaI